MPAALAATDLTKRFHGVTAVEGLTFDVHPGEIFGLVGPDGAGKTTTLRMLSGVLTPDSGSAMVAGHDILRDPELAAAQRTPERWFDTAAFAQPARFRFGTSARSVGRIPGRTGFDLGIMKNFPVGERIRFQFRAEMFNAFNHVNFGVPGTTLDSPNFGAINAADAARVIQFGLKINF